MTVKVFLLKSGEDVICDAKEILDKQENGIVAFHFTNPYVMQILEKQEESDELVADDSNEVKPKSTFQVQYVNWAPLSKQREFVVTADWIVTMYDPHDQIMKDYCAKHSIAIEEDGNPTDPA